jgi:hypothetical protein
VETIQSYDFVFDVIDVKARLADAAGDEEEEAQPRDA